MHPYGPPPQSPYSPPSPYGQHAPMGYGPPGFPPNPGAGAMYRENVFVPPGQTRAGEVPSSWIRNAKLGGGVLQLLALGGFIAGMIVSANGANGDGATGEMDPAAAVALGLFGLWYLLLIAGGILNLVWLYKFWSWIPPEQRHTKMWKKYISPGQALGFMFIPYFNVYWMFVVFLGIHDVLDRMRVAYPTREVPSKPLALVALIGPFFFFPAGPFFHFAFERHVERIAREMQPRMPAAMG